MDPSPQLKLKCFMGWAGPPFPSSIKLQKYNQILNHSTEEEKIWSVAVH